MKNIPRRGAAAVELAILLPFLALIFSAVIDFGRVFYATQALDNAASVAAMAASGTTWVPSTTTTADAAKAAAVTEGATLSPALTAEQVSVTVAGGAATVTVTYDFPLLTGSLIPGRSVSLQRSSTVRVAPRPGD
ncbi:TadE family protein [Limnoglobus roseus]|uniref:Pilus assembly protein n=1 Tax=Limnoglobus roseus TaxID=2598579 RepID=A0A5C1ASK1_9BACT|nr:TadE family protein [Limnoglobus roseus]QEL21016.1 pilus assembly protein [Limnoglobus roseus]